MNRFTNPFDPDNTKIKAALRQWALAHLQLEDTTPVDIIEHTCSEPNCVHAETVISVGDTEGGRFFKISKPLVYIRKWDVPHWKEISHQQVTHQH
jgi:hypothetical protein